MRLFSCLVLLSLATIVISHTRIRIIRSIQSSPPTVAESVIRQIQKERRERRILRKKKQRLRELREEIRALTLSLDSEESTNLPLLNKEKLQKNKNLRKDAKWKKRLLEKIKLIVRRLDSMERKVLPDKTSITKMNRNRFQLTTTSIPLLIPTSTPVSIRTSISPPNKLSDKVKRLQLSAIQSRNGDNGTACATHKDCRPGRCCHRMEVKGAIQSVCVFHSLEEEAPCLDSCQCAHRLHCFRAENNNTRPVCKKASSDDILHGTYLYDKDSIFKSKRKKK